eukprot:scaffold4850_cov213-Pinguiococcus_pyrenoidosus.AAC.1
MALEAFHEVGGANLVPGQLTLHCTPAAKRREILNEGGSLVLDSVQAQTVLDGIQTCRNRVEQLPDFLLKAPIVRKEGGCSALDVSPYVLEAVL